MNYDETLDYLYSHLPMYHRIGSAAYKKDLTNTVALCDFLHHPETQFTSIHVAGTNGKGSVSNMLASILFEAGYSTGLYTSPHLIDFRERIRVNGNMCEKEYVVGFIERMKKEIERIQPSFFELTVAMAFDYFASQKVEIAVVEVGLGGRLDSTNIIHPVLSVITNISFDHMQMLGNTLPEIAAEKAGIIKFKVPVVIGEHHKNTFPVFQEKAIGMQSEIFLADENVQIEIQSDTIDGFELNVSYLNQLIYPGLLPGLKGSYQVANIKTVIQSVEVLRTHGIEIPDEAVYDGIAKVKSNMGFAGRFDIISRSPLIIIDSAHNAGGLEQLFRHIRKLRYIKLRIVTGAVNDKDLNASLGQYPVEAVYYFCRPDIPRGLDEQALRSAAHAYNLVGKTYSSVSTALMEATKDAEPSDLILICGSIFVAAEALAFFR